MHAWFYLSKIVIPSSFIGGKRRRMMKDLPIYLRPVKLWLNTKVTEIRRPTTPILEIGPPPLTQNPWNFAVNKTKSAQGSMLNLSVETLQRIYIFVPLINRYNPPFFVAVLHIY